MEDKALTILAEMLNKARIQANAIEMTAPQSGVYGDIVKALNDTLVILTDSPSLAAQVYASILDDGCTVQEAITANPIIL